MWPLKYTHSHTIALRLSASALFLLQTPFSPPVLHTCFLPTSCHPRTWGTTCESNPLPTPCPPTATLQFLSVPLQLNFSSLCAAFLESPPSLLTSCTHCPRKQGHHCLYKITNGLLVIKSQHLYSVSTISLIILMLSLIMTLATIYWATKMVQVAC